MKKTFLVVAAFTVIFTVGAYAQQNGNTTRYWDACKPSCGWSANAGGGNSYGTCKSCNAAGALVDDNMQSVCSGGGGGAHTCMKQAPWEVSTDLAYGFAANNAVGCGKCVELSFSGTLSGKKMIVMATNIGDLSGAAHFDLMIPGGGVGAMGSSAFTNQLKTNGVSNPNLGAERGGFLATCGPNASCIRNMCDAAFGTSALADLKAGCYWFIDWFKMADNPAISYKEVTCPQALIDKYKGNFSATPTPPTPTTYTLTVNRNPANGGSVKVNNNDYSSPVSVSGGTVSISATPASGYTFSNWTVSGSGTFANASASSTTVTVNGNITVTANFSNSSNPPTPVKGDTIKVEAENYASKVGDKMVKETGNGITNIGYIENGYSATYNVTAGKAGSATMQFRIANEGQTTFTVEVNGQSVGTISQASTGSWTTYITVTLGNAVNLKSGQNTVVLKFGSPVNVDYFLLIGDIKGSTSVRRTAAGREASVHNIALKPARSGFSAVLPANHGYTSYKLIDVLGREIRSGKIDAGANGLSVSGLKQSVFFLKLEGSGKTPTALKVATY